MQYELVPDLPVTNPRSELWPGHLAAEENIQTHHNKWPIFWKIPLPFKI